MERTIPDRIYIELRGCSRRALDAARFKKYFLANDFTVTKSPKKSDYILLITCAFRKIEEDLAIRRIRELSRCRAQLIVGGCLKGINKERLYENFKGPAFTASDNEYIDELFPDFKVKFSDIPDANAVYPRNKLQIFREYLFALRPDLSCLKRLKDYLERKVLKKYYYIRIGWGCVEEHCAYCVIWRAIGKLKSKPIGDCLAEFRRGLKNGYKNIALVADNVGAYGLDAGLTFPDLLGKLLEVDGDYNLEFEWLHPFWLIKYSDRLEALLRSGKIRLLQCPIQSANDRILGLMNRRHNKARLKEALLKMRSSCRGLRFHTHIMAGFPSETEAEFDETLDFLREIGFDQVLIYGYSRNPLADPEITKQELSEETIRERVNKAISFCRRNGIACATA